MRAVFVRLWCLLLLGVPAACDSPAGPRTTPPPAILAVEVDSADGPIFRTLVVRLDAPGTLEVRYTAAGVATLRVGTAAADTLHRLFLPRLRPAREYGFAATASAPGGAAGSQRAGTFGTGALPDRLAGFSFETAGIATEPITMLEVWFSELGWWGLVAVDRGGEIVWYWQTERRPNGFRRRANGNFVVIEGDQIVEVTPSRQVVHVLPRAGVYGEIHHDLEVTAENTVLFLARDPREADGGEVVGEAIWEWTPETGAVRERWSSWDHFAWPADSGSASEAGNWFHANSLAFGPRRNILVSARNLDEVFSIAPDFGAVEWRLGGSRPTVALADGDRFYGQHSAVATGPTRIVLFDNGFGRPDGGYSRVLELDVDAAAGAATRAGGFRPAPDNHAMRVGSVRRLANGHTVATFGWGDPDPVEVFELDTSWNVVWRLVAGAAVQRIYRGTPWPHIGGEQELP
jgi:hypothetical protein